jgi:hypothetical protein
MNGPQLRQRRLAWSVRVSELSHAIGRTRARVDATMSAQRDDVAPEQVMAPQTSE